MDRKERSYETEEITVTYDVKRCIHAEECVKGLASVFDPQKRPWIQPENASAEKIMEIVERCPTGALHYNDKKGNRSEAADSVNTITIVPDGPVYLRGNIEVRDAEGDTILEDSRLALCRCGKSGNKPACDNSHRDIPFRAPAGFDRSSLTEENPEHDDSKLILKVQKNGPVLVEGKYQIHSVAEPTINCSKTIALCRCGQSSNKPFCDGTHKKVGFEA